jgi:hypothetical protein
MATVITALSFPGTVHEAERCWYDASRWPAWVDGLERVVDVAGGWPAVGGLLTWNSGPAGRGRVIERVEQYEPLAGQTADVDDDSISAAGSPHKPAIIPARALVARRAVVSCFAPSCPVEAGGETGGSFLFRAELPGGGWLRDGR